MSSSGPTLTRLRTRCELQADLRTSDVRAATKPRIFAADCINAIAAYVLHEVTAGMLGWRSFDVLYATAARIVGPVGAVLAPIAVFLAWIWFVMRALQRRGWVIKI